jgi:hypothetical protein
MCEKVAGQLSEAAIIGKIEQVVDAANLLALDLAINAFETGAADMVPIDDLRIIRSLTEKGSQASDEIGRLMRVLHAS